MKQHGALQQPLSTRRVSSPKKGPNPATKSRHQLNRAFGSGASVCPGRHFAANEMITILVMMILKYDIPPVDGDWKMPKTKSHITTSILTPVEDIRFG